jgi:hypothetical protein
MIFFPLSQHMVFPTRPKVDDNVDEKDGVRQTVEGNPPGAEIVVEEADGHRQDYQVGHEQ